MSAKDDTLKKEAEMEDVGVYSNHPSRLSEVEPGQVITQDV
jgi:hypothetical protein